VFFFKAQLVWIKDGVIIDRLEKKKCFYEGGRITLIN
jgi:hypothetical protein